MSNKTMDDDYVEDDGGEMIYLEAKRTADGVEWREVPGDNDGGMTYDGLMTHLESKRLAYGVEWRHTLKLCIKPGHGNNPCLLCTRWKEETQSDFVIFVEGTDEAVCWACAHQYSPQLVDAVALLDKATADVAQPMLPDAGEDEAE
jgi:hypothetical protein